MENFDLWPQLAALGQVIAIDLVLAGDNAIVVGMAAATVPLEQRRKVIFWGIGAAIALRIFLGHGNDSDTEGTHRGELMQEPPLTAVGVH
jgi:predicted tellurium resistance membrane protein TerC